MQTIKAQPALLDAQASVGGSSFYLALRLLPPAKRKAMFEIYRFCRLVDDIADGGGDRDWRLAELARWREDIEALFRGVPPPRAGGLLGPVADFNLQRNDFLAVIDGMNMDASSEICAPDLATLDLYCNRVACAVGRLSVRIFGMQPGAGTALAFHLGTALQLTNILRDLDEDARMGRLYLPREALGAAGIGVTEPEAVLAHPALSDACVLVADRALGEFARAAEVMATEPAGIVRTPSLMAKVYRQLLARLLARGWASPRRPVRLGRGDFVWILLQHELSGMKVIRKR